MYVKMLLSEHLLFILARLVSHGAFNHKHIRKYYVVSAIKITKFVASNLNSQV